MILKVSEGGFHRAKTIRSFLDIEPIGKVREHSHKAQWGIVIEGEMELTIGGVTKTYKKGDSYYIPDGVVHSAVFNCKTRALDFFNERERYKPVKPDNNLLVSQ